MDPTLLLSQRKISLLDSDPELIETAPLYRNNFTPQFTEKIVLKDFDTSSVGGTSVAFWEGSELLTNLGKKLLELSPLEVDESIVAANLDAIFKFTGHVLGVLNPQVPDTFSEYMFVDLFGNPGGFTEYLQWRRPHSSGFGLAKTSESRREVTDWNTARLNLHEFRPFEYDSNLTPFENYELFNSLIGNRDIDLVYGLSEDPSLLLFEIVTSLKLVKKDGNVIIKLPVHILEESGIVDLIYLISKCFKTLSVFHPLTSNVRYLICWSSLKTDLGRPSQAQQFLTSLLKDNIDIRQIDTLVEGNLPIEFEDWLDRQYQYFVWNDDPNEYNITKILTMWGIPAGPGVVSKKNSYEEGISNRVGTMYRNLMKLDPVYLNEFFFNTISNISNMDEAIHRLSVRTNIDESTIRTRLDVVSKGSNLEVNRGDILTTVTTSRGFRLTMKTNRFDFLTTDVQNFAEETAGLIDRYSFYTMECLKFEFRDSLNHLTEAISSPLTNTLEQYYSLYSGDSIFGSKGTFTDMINSDLDNLIFVLPSNVKLMNLIYDKLKDVESKELYFVAPYWPDHPLIKWITEKGKTVLSTREKVFTRLDFSNVNNPDGKIVIGYMGKSYEIPPGILSMFTE